MMDSSYVNLYTATVTFFYEKDGQPLSPQGSSIDGIDARGWVQLYDTKVLKAAFKKAVKLVSVVGHGLSLDDDDDVAFDINGKEGKVDEFIGGQLIL